MGRRRRRRVGSAVRNGGEGRGGGGECEQWRLQIIRSIRAWRVRGRRPDGAAEGLAGWLLRSPDIFDCFHRFWFGGLTDNVDSSAQWQRKQAASGQARGHCACKLQASCGCLSRTFSLGSAQLPTSLGMLDIWASSSARDSMRAALRESTLAAGSNSSSGCGRPCSCASAQLKSYASARSASSAASSASLALCAASSPSSSSSSGSMRLAAPSSAAALAPSYAPPPYAPPPYAPPPPPPPLLSSAAPLAVCAVGSASTGGGAAPMLLRSSGSGWASVVKTYLPCE